MLVKTPWLNVKLWSLFSSPDIMLIVEGGIVIMRGTLILFAVIIAVGALIAQYADKVIQPKGRGENPTSRLTSSSSVQTISAPPLQEGRAQNETVPASKLPEIVKLAPSARSIILWQDSAGHYRTEARVDGMRVEFLVDTGATAVMLSAPTAGKLGIRPARSEYTARVMTANGEIRAAMVRLNKIELGDIAVRDVRALVHSDEKLGVDLLGMTFLSQVRWTHDRGKLIIEPLSNN